MICNDMVQEYNIYNIVITKLIKTTITVKHSGPCTTRGKLNRKDKLEISQDHFLRAPKFRLIKLLQEYTTQYPNLKPKIYLGYARSLTSTSTHYSKNLQYWKNMTRNISKSTIMRKKVYTKFVTN